MDRKTRNLSIKSLIFCILLIGLFTVTVYAAGYYQKTVEVNWVVVESKGIEVSTSRILLGEIPQGSSKSASFWVKNTSSETLYVRIMWPITLNGITITVNPNTFFLKPNQTKNITITITVAEFVSPGPYNTTLYITATPSPIIPS